MTRKRKWISCCLIALALAMIFLFAPIYPYRPYRLLHADDGWVPYDEWLTADHCDEFALLLSKSHEWHIRLTDRLILIPLRLKLDHELTGNYSQKAGLGRNIAPARTTEEQQRFLKIYGAEPETAPE